MLRIKYITCLVFLFYVFIVSVNGTEIKTNKAKRLDNGSNSFSLNNAGTAWIFNPTVLSGSTKLTGLNGIELDFTATGNARILNSATGNADYITFKRPYGNASYNTASGSGSSITVVCTTANTYYPFKDLTSQSVSGTGYITFRNDSGDDEGDGFNIGTYGAGVYKCMGWMTFTASAANTKVYPAFYKNNTKQDHTEFGGEYANEFGTVTFGGYITVSDGDRITVKFAQSKASPTTVYVIGIGVTIERISQ